MRPSYTAAQGRGDARQFLEAAKMERQSLVAAFLLPPKACRTRPVGQGLTDPAPLAGLEPTTCGLEIRGPSGEAYASGWRLRRTYRADWQSPCTRGPSCLNEGASAPRRPRWKRGTQPFQ